MRVKCLYCDVENEGLVTGEYCESCGKKLPSSAMMKPRRTLGGDAPALGNEGPGQASKRYPVSEALFATAIVHLFAGGLFLTVGSMFYRPVPDRFAPDVMLWTILPTLALGGLGLLARSSPMPMVFVALILTLLWMIATFILHLALAVGWLFVDVALLGMLGWALWRGANPTQT